MPVVSAHAAQHLFAVSPYYQAIRLGLHLGGQRRRIHQIGKEQDQPPDLTNVSGVCQQTFGIGRTVSHLDIVSPSSARGAGSRGPSASFAVPRCQGKFHIAGFHHVSAHRT